MRRAREEPAASGQRHAVRTPQPTSRAKSERRAGPARGWRRQMRTPRASPVPWSRRLRRDRRTTRLRSACCARCCDLGQRKQPLRSPHCVPLWQILIQCPRSSLLSSLSATPAERVRHWWRQVMRLRLRRGPPALPASPGAPVRTLARGLLRQQLW